MKERIHLFGRAAGHAPDGLKILDRSLLNASQALEVAEKFLFSNFSNTGNVIEYGVQIFSSTQFPVIRNRKPVGLIPNPLKQ